jgi:3-oxoacyl-[acyl-carrier protein] reductase
MSGRLAGKIALVTGASRGLGRATALLFAREGAAVAVNYAERGDAAGEVVAAIREAGGRALALRANVANQPEVAAMVAQALEAFGRLDVLVNNAGVSHPGSLLTLDEARLDEMIAVNLKGVIHCCRAAAPGMIERRYGKIVNIASIAGLGTALQGTTPYAATKAAVIALTKRLALELGPHGINVNAICPGFIRTDMAAASADERDFESIAGKAMLGRVGRPEDIAAAALFLASDEASFVTAQVLTVDGGRTDFLSHSG